MVWNEKKQGEGLWMSARNALLGVVMLQVFNITTVLYLIKEYVSDINITDFFEDKTKTVTAGIMMIILNYFLLIHNKKYLEFAKKYENENDAEIKRGVLILRIYVFATFAIPIIWAVLVGIYRR